MIGRTESRIYLDGGANIETRYSNYLAIGQNAFEFILDFGQHYEGRDGERIHTRIVTSPFYAKWFKKLLEETIAQYEAKYGAIPNEAN
jgi:hypothetical protein